MKSMFLTVFGLAAAVAAQSADDLPQCGQTCAANMISEGKSRELGCDTGDVRCLCTNQNFIYGIRDCSRAICNDEQAAQVLEYGLEVCRRAGVAITTGASGTVEATATGATGAVRTVFRTITSDGSVITTAVSTISGAGDENEDETATEESATGASVSTYTSVFTNSDGDVVTTTGETTVGAGGVRLTTFTSGGTEIVRTIATETATADEGEDNLTTFTSGGTQIIRTLVTETASTGTAGEDDDNLTTFTSDGTEIVRTLTTETVGTESGSVTETVTDDSTATETEGATETGEETGTATGGASETTTDNAAMPQVTAAPAGILAAAGLAMLLL
ncbi:hypothetical protein ACJ41O_004632 [Fusarium nematophilum]